MNEQASILYVDDEPDILELVGLQFAENQVRIMTARNAQEAMEMCRRHRFRVVISDARMPGMKGVEFYHELQRSGFFHGHFILVSGHYDAHQPHGVPAGISKVLTKPIDFDELWRAVKPHLG